MKVLKIALVPTRRGISSNRKGAFTKEDAVMIRNEVSSRLAALNHPHLEIVRIDWLNEEGMMTDVSHADLVYERLKAEDIDAVFILHANFGCEEAVGRLCKRMDKPVLLWGPRDRAIAEDGSRSTDTQCGLFASSRLLMRYGVPFTYIENCTIDSPQFQQGFDAFVRTAAVARTFNNLRLGLVNTRPKYFTSVMINESELLEKFGIEVVPINIAEVMSTVDRIKSQEPDRFAQASGEIRGRIDCSGTDPETVDNAIRLRLALADLAQKHQVAGLAIECWTVTPQLIHALPCLAIGELTDQGVPGACEGDIHGLIGSLLLQAASLGEGKPFFGEYTMRSSDDDQTELIWHCGNAPCSTCGAGSTPRFDNGREGFALGTGDVTVVRFDANRGQYYLLADEAESVPGPYTTGTYLWAKTADWSKWERKFINGPFIHHVSVISGRYQSILKEACKYFKGNVLFDSVDIEREYQFK